MQFIIEKTQTLVNSFLNECLVTDRSYEIIWKKLTSEQQNSIFNIIISEQKNNLLERIFTFLNIEQIKILLDLPNFKFLRCHFRKENKEFNKLSINERIKICFSLVKLFEIENKWNEIDIDSKKILIKNKHFKNNNLNNSLVEDFFKKLINFEKNREYKNFIFDCLKGDFDVPCCIYKDNYNYNIFNIDEFTSIIEKDSNFNEDKLKYIQTYYYERIIKVLIKKSRTIWIHPGACHMIIDSDLNDLNNYIDEYLFDY